MINSLHILVTDFNHNLRNFLKRELTREGFVVYTAKSSKEAQNYIYGPNPLDLVIFDPQLKDLMGLSLFKSIQDRIPPVPVIVHTYRDFFSDLAKEENVYCVEKNTWSLEPLKNKIFELTSRF